MPTPPHKKRNKKALPNAEGVPKGALGIRDAESTPPPHSPHSNTPPQDLPDPDTVITEVPFTSPKGHTYRIIVTNQTDQYDPPLPPEGSEQKAVRRRRRKKSHVRNEK
jgi:hypothetical protein